MNNLHILEPKLEVKVDKPLLISIDLPEEEKRTETNVLTITDMPFELAEHILNQLHPLELYCCYGVSQGISDIVKNNLHHPKSLGIYFSDKVSVVFADGMYAKYTKGTGKCGYAYGTYNDDEIPFERKEREGYLNDVKYDEAGLNVFTSILTMPGNHIEKLMIRFKKGYNPNKHIARIEKALVSLKEKLAVACVDFTHLNPKQVMRILPYLMPGTLKTISIFKSACGEEDNATLRKISRTQQWRHAEIIYVMFPSMIPIRNFLHLQMFSFIRENMTARELANFKNSLFKHQHIGQVELYIRNTEFDRGIARRVLGPCTPDETQPDAGFYHGPNGTLDLYMYRDDDGSTGVFITRLDE